MSRVASAPDDRPDAGGKIPPLPARIAFKGKSKGKSPMTIIGIIGAGEVGSHIVPATLKPSPISESPSGSCIP
jgi:hypothetical protein